MEVENQPVDQDDSTENCEELDDDFFTSIGQTFDIVDSWEDKEDTKNGKTVPKPLMQGKEPDESAKKKFSDSRKGSSPSRRERSRNPDPRLRSRSPDRRTRFPRVSPPWRRNSPFRGRNSPPRRRNSPPRARDTGRKSFLEEMSALFPDIQAQNQNMPMHYNQNYPMMQPQMGYPQHQMGFMGGQGYMQPMMQGPMGQPQFPGVNPMMAPMPVPAPVADGPPGTTLGIPGTSLGIPGPSFGVSATSDNSLNKPAINPPAPKEPSIKPASKSIDLNQIKTKAFKNREISITEYLKQVQNQTSQKASISRTEDKLSKVLEATRDAVKILDDKPRLPFTLKISKESLPSLKQIPKMSKRSPLMMSDNNVLFLSQAKLMNLRNAMESNPYRNISGKYFTLCKDAGLDLNKISEGVKMKVEIEKRKTIMQQTSRSTDISSNIVDSFRMKIHRSSQTIPLECMKCVERAEQDDETGNFIIRLDARAVSQLTREQEAALAEVCKAFNLEDDRFKPLKPVRNSQWDSDEEDRIGMQSKAAGNHRIPSSEHGNRRRLSRDSDDSRIPLRGIEDRRISPRGFEDPRIQQRDFSRDNAQPFPFANPEPPNHFNDDDDSPFISYSPIRRSKSRSRGDRSMSRSPKRRRIVDRLGEKVPSPRHPRNLDDIDRLVNPERPYRIETPPSHVDYFRDSISPKFMRENRLRNDRSESPEERLLRRGRY